jgi:ribosome maturation factor RimP
VARTHGLEVFDVQLRREPIGMVLRVVIDRPDRGRVETPDEAVGIEDCQRVSQDLSALLDVEDEFGQQDLGDKYTLEVSSPGLDRPLRTPEHFAGVVGQQVRLRVLGKRQLKGEVVSAGDQTVTVAASDGAETEIPYHEIVRANLIAMSDLEQKGA